jgi:hypothetical protein
MRYTIGTAFRKMTAALSIGGTCMCAITRRMRLRGIAQTEAERGRRLQEANRRAAADRLWYVHLQARLAVAGDAPSFSDVKLATGVQPMLRLAGMA